MTRTELCEILEKRVGWRQPTASSFVLSDEAKETESGRYFQDAHEFIKLKTIHSILETPDLSNEDFSKELVALRKRVVLSVVDDVFDTSSFNRVELDNCPTLFDTVISKKMVIRLSEMLFSSTRTNLTERFGRDAMRLLYIDVNGEKDSDKMTISDGYNKELKYIKDLFNTEDMIDTHTLGTPSDYLDENYRYG